MMQTHVELEMQDRRGQRAPAARLVANLEPWLTQGSSITTASQYQTSHGFKIWILIRGLYSSGFLRHPTI